MTKKIIRKSPHYFTYTYNISDGWDWRSSLQSPHKTRQDIKQQKWKLGEGKSNISVYFQGVGLVWNHVRLCAQILGKGGLQVFRTYHLLFHGSYNYIHFRQVICFFFSSSYTEIFKQIESTNGIIQRKFNLRISNSAFTVGGSLA